MTRVTLQNGFEIAHGDLELIKDRLKNPSVWGACPVAASLKMKAVDPNHDIQGSNRTFLIKQGLLDDNGDMSDEVRNVVFVVYELEPEGGRAQIDHAVCTPPDLSRLET